MRKSIYIQFFLVIAALGVLFYVLLFHDTTYIEVPSPIGGFSENDGATPPDETEPAETGGDMVKAPEKQAEQPRPAKVEPPKEQPREQPAAQPQVPGQKPGGQAPPPPSKKDSEDIGKTMRPPNPQDSRNGGRPAPPSGGNAGRPGGPPPGGRPGQARQETNYDGSQPKNAQEETLYR